MLVGVVVNIADCTKSLSNEENKNTVVNLGELDRPLLGTVETPSFLPVAGTYATTQNVTLTSTTSGATICYAVSSLQPVCNAEKTGCTTGTLYNSGISITNTKTVNAVACKTDYADSAIGSAGYAITNIGGVTSFTATAGNGQIALNWINPDIADFAGVKVMRQTGNYPVNKDDGIMVYDGTDTTVIDTGLTNGTQYYYAAFAYDTLGNYTNGARETTVPVDAPLLISSTPTNGTTQVPVCTGAPCTAKIVLGFSESMQTSPSPTLITEVNSDGVWQIMPNEGTTFQWSNTNKTLTITLSWYWFPENSKIRYTIAAADLKSAGGGANPITAQVQHSFTTGSAGRTFTTISDTGQTKCYDTNGSVITCVDAGFPRQDGFYLNIPNARSFTGPTPTGSDYTTKDNVTNLVWKTCSEDKSDADCTTGTASPMTWNNAVNKCAALNTANSGTGYASIKTWRLPTYAELQTLVDYEESTPAISATYFPSTVATSYWSSTTSVTNTRNAWRVGFNNGNSNYDDKTHGNSVRCVSSGQPIAIAAFTDNGNGTVTATATGLVWQKCTEGQTPGTTCKDNVSMNKYGAITKTWQEALTTCKNLTLAGKTWRLPSINELLSIVDMSKYQPAIDTSFFPASVTTSYWSSTTDVSNPTNAWHVYFAHGYVSSYNKTTSNYVRCVSGP